jgi:hypothetical protein
MRTIPLPVSILFAYAANHVLEMLRHTLVEVRVVHRTQQLPDSNLSLTPQADFMLMGTLAHGIMRLRPVRIRLDSIEICLTVFHFVTIPHSPWFYTHVIEPWSGPSS